MPDSYYSKFNFSELYQTCRNAGIVCLASESKEKLIAYLEGDDVPDPRDTHQIDRWRHGIMGFILEYWRKLEAQLTCPARSKNPLSCFQCVDSQVICCVVQGKSHESLIRIHLPSGEKMSGSSMDVSNAPRDAEKLASAGAFWLKNLAKEASRKLGSPLSDEEQLAFQREPVSNRAVLVLEMLQKLDKANGGAPAASATPAHHVAPPTPAPAHIAATPARTPVQAAPAPSRTPQAQESSGSEDAVVGRVLSEVKPILDQLSKSIGHMSSIIQSQEKATNNDNAEIKESIQRLATAVETCHNVSTLVLATLLQFVEAQASIPSSDFLRAVEDEFPSIQKTIIDMTEVKN